MRNRFLALAALSCFSSSAMAVPINFQVGYSIDAHQSGDGLLIETADLVSNPFAFTLDTDGVDSWTTDLFRIWTDEDSVNYGEDTEARSISVDFSFWGPAAGSLSVTGTTRGAYEDYFVVYWEELGKLEWDAPVWNYSFGNGGLLQISLSDADFNHGAYGTDSGYRDGKDVRARFTLVNAPVSVPEPGSIALIGAALIGMGLIRRRRAQA